MSHTRCRITGLAASTALAGALLVIAAGPAAAAPAQSADQVVIDPAPAVTEVAQIFRPECLTCMAE